MTLGLAWLSGKVFGWQRRDPELNPLPNDKFSDWSKLKAFADDKINVS